uniref:ATP-dependent NAD(P)H-hydrate dehydratase n=1 Tax=Caenorhabditis tropicalis TaxID=1561998 RepID=A0A1I7U5P5_9PELO
MTASSIIPKLNRMDAIVIGPGLGRHPGNWPLMQELFHFVKNQKVPFVIDGDGLWFVSEHIEHFPRQMVTTVLTPNIVEFSRLCKSALGEEDVLNVRSHSQLQHLAAELSRKMDVTIYMKGEVDLVVTPNGEGKCDPLTMSTSSFSFEMFDGFEFKEMWRSRGCHCRKSGALLVLG